MRYAQFISIALAPLLALSGCDKDLGAQTTGLQSIQVTMKAPLPDSVTGNIGSPQQPVNLSQVTFDLTAIGPDGKPLAQDFDVDVYLSFGGNKVGKITACGDGADSTPLTTIHLSGGVATNQTVQLVRAYGESTLWLQERTTQALGASPRIYFASPTIPDIQTPLDINAPTATYCTPFNNRHVIINSATGNGRLVVTSLFGGAYVIADTGAMYDPMKPGSGFNHLYVFSFSQPDKIIQPGLIVQDVSGNLSKFNGFSELNFPLQDPVTMTDPNTQEMLPVYDKTAIPPPYPLGVADKGNDQELIALAGATVKITGSVCCIATGGSNCCGMPAGCMPDEQWVKYNTFTLDVGDNVCDSFNGFAVALPAKVFGIDPLMLASKPTTITFTGMLQNSSGQNDACKNTATAAPVDCMTNDDCLRASNKPGLDPKCSTALTKATCVEGTCRKGVFNFFTIVPRTPDDIVVNK